MEVNSSFAHIPGLELFRAVTTYNKYKRKGATAEDAIVLDDDDDTEQSDFIELSDYRPSVKFESLMDTSPTVDLSDAEDVLIYGEEFQKSVQSLTDPVADRNGLQQDIQVSETPNHSYLKPSIRSNAPRTSWNGYRTQTTTTRAPEAHMYPSQKKKQLIAEPILCKGSLENKRIHDEGGEAIANRTQLKADKIHDRILPVAPQQAERCLVKKPIAKAGSGIDKSAPLSQRLGLAPLTTAKDDPRYAELHSAKSTEPLKLAQVPAKPETTTTTKSAPPISPKVTPVTDSEAKSSERLGFAALPSAKDDPRYAHLYADKGAGTLKPVPKPDMPASSITTKPTASPLKPDKPAYTMVPKPTSAHLSKDLPALAPKATPKKPRKPPAKKPDPAPPTDNVLKANRKRPLSEIAVGQLFAPRQVISSSEYEQKKRQRLEKKRDHEVQDITIPTSNRERIHNGNDKEPESAESLSVEFEGAVTATNIDMEDKPYISPGKLQYRMKTISASAPKAKGTNPKELQDKVGVTSSVVQEAGGIQAPPVSEAQPQRKSTKTTGSTESVLPPSTSTSPVTVIDTLDIPTIVNASPTQPASVGEKSVPKKQTTLDLASRGKDDLHTKEAEAQHTEQPALTARPTTGGKGISAATLAARSSPPIPPARPTKGGKGISAATLAAWHASSKPHSSPVSETVDIGYEPVFHYHIIVRQYQPNFSSSSEEIDVTESRLGPFLTMEEANKVAEREVRYPIENDALDGGEDIGMEWVSEGGKGWSYMFEQDGVGCQTHVVEVLGWRVEAGVERDLAPPEPRPSFPASAFKLTRNVFLVQEMRWFPLPPPAPSLSPLTPHNTSTNPHPSSSLPCQPSFAPTTKTATATAPPSPSVPHCTTTTHISTTTLPLANRLCADQYLACLTGRWSDFGAEGVRKSEVEREVKRELKRLEAEGELWVREVVFESGDGKGKGMGKGDGGGGCRFWVQEVEVRGPRN